MSPVPAPAPASAPAARSPDCRLGALPVRGRDRSADRPAKTGSGEPAADYGTPDGSLLHLRDSYPIETTWAPKWIGDELRQVRVSAT